MTQLYNSKSGEVNEHLLSLARGPVQQVMCYKGYVINGFRFHTKDREKERKTQSSGVFVTGETNSYASARDNNPIVGNIDYYGILTDVIELHYLGGNRVVLFKCDWRDVYSQRRGIKVDLHGFICLNFTRSLRTNEPFILACQAKQVFYVRDTVDSDWYIVQKFQPRDFYNMHMQGEVLNDDDEEEVFNDDAYQQNETCGVQCLPYIEESEGDVLSWHRTDIPGQHVDPTEVAQQTRKKRKKK